MTELHLDLLRNGVAYVDQWVAYQQERRDIPGVVVAIRHADQLLLAKGYGYADLERQALMTPGHIFRVASHSKTFTATAIMQLVEHGKLRLDDPLAASIPWLQHHERLSRVTVRQALNHTTGIVRDGHDADYWALDHAFPDAAGLRQIVEEGAAVLNANESLKYSNIAYSLLGLVIEGISGLSYHQYVKTRIVDRLGLTDTGPEIDDHAAARLARGYTRPGYGLPRRPLPDIATGAMAAATGFYSTAGDLCHYAAAHFFGDTTLLSDDAKREMQQPYWEVRQADEHYGLGFVVQQIGDRRLIGHGGGFPGYITRTLIDTRDRLVVVVLTNEVGGPARMLATTIVKILNFALQQPATGTSSSMRLDRFAGRFAGLWGDIDVAHFGTTLVSFNPDMDDPVNSPTILEVIDDATLRIIVTNGYGSAGELVRYQYDPSGKIARVIFAGTSVYPPEIFRRQQLGDAPGSPV